jgi:hypothetical protein
MTPYRRQTQLPPPQHAQPVYFYKIIALTFLCITLVLLGLVVFMSSKRAVVMIETKTTPIDISTDVVLGSDDVPFDAMVTSTIVTFTKSFSPTGSKELPGIATGQVTVFNETDADQSLVATTRLLTANNVLFRLKNPIRVPAKGSVIAEVYADQEGATFNIPPQDRFTIPGLTEAKQAVIYAKSTEPMTGGVKTIGVLSSDDVEKAKQVVSAGFIEQAKLLLPASFLTTTTISFVADESFVVNGDIGKEVDGFTITGTATVVMVSYDDVSLMVWVKEKLLARAVDSTEIIYPQEELPIVTFSAFDTITSQATLSVVYGGQATLNPDSEKLEKSVFFGQTKDEVRRYLLTLDHVHGVDVKLSPAWIRSVPYVDDHVKVIVKKVQ